MLLYLESNRPALAARLMLENATYLLKDEALVENVIKTLRKNELYDKVKTIFLKTFTHKFFFKLLN